ATFHKKKFMHHRCCMVFTSGTTEDTEERRGVNHKGHEGTGKGAGLIFRFWQFRRLWQFWQFLQPRQSAVRPLPPSAYSVSSAFQRCWVLHNYNLSRELDLCPGCDVGCNANPTSPAAWTPTYCARIADDSCSPQLC